MNIDWKGIGKQLAKLGLPLLGGAVGGPGGAIVGKAISAAIGLADDATPEQIGATLGNVSGEQMVALRALEVDLEKARIAADSARDASQVSLIQRDQEKGFFDRGWRPTAAWACVAGLVYTFLLRPLLPWVLQVAGVSAPVLPPIDTMELFVMLGGMLGLSGLRHRERLRGKA